MKVCILTHSFPPAQGAAELYIGNLARGLRKEGIDVSVLTAAHLPSLPLYEEWEGVKVYRMPMRGPPQGLNFEFMLCLPARLREVYEKERFDLLHSEHLFPIPRGGAFAREVGVPHVGVIEGISRVSPYSKIVCLVHRLLLPRTQYDILAVWSRFLIDEFLRGWGVGGDIRIIPGGVDTEKFNPQVDGSAVRRELQDHEGQRIIFTAKPMVKTNALGLAYVIKAMELVVKEYPDCKLVMGGAGRKKGELEELARRLGLAGHVQFVGWIPQVRMPEYYAAADVVVDSIVYRHAGSVTVLESLASGRPNVLCDIECLPGEVSRPSGDIAKLVRPADAEDMARGILEILRDESLGRELGRKGREFIEYNFSMGKVVKEYKALYEELLR